LRIGRSVDRLMTQTGYRRPTSLNPQTEG
jgi:hypothetical protein